MEQDEQGGANQTHKSKHLGVADGQPVTPQPPPLPDKSFKSLAKRKIRIISKTVTTEIPRKILIVIIAIFSILLLASSSHLFFQRSKPAPATQQSHDQAKDTSARRNRCSTCGGFYCYMPGTPIVSDRLSFEEVCRVQLSKDENYVYSYDVVLEGADPETFQALSAWYYKDNNTVWKSRSIISEADVATFDVLDPEDAYTEFAKDKNYVYKTGRILEGLDPETFVLITNDIWKDKNSVYKGRVENVVSQADPETFVLLNQDYGGIYAKDVDSVFFNFDLVSQADANSFEYVKNGYGKDKSNTFYQGKLLAGADAKSFGAFELNNCTASYGYRNVFGKDSYNVYYQDQLISGADPKSFTGISNCYAKDSDSYYLYNNPVTESHREMCNYGDINLSDANVLPLYPQPNSRLTETQPTITGKIVDYQNFLIDVELKQLNSPYDGELHSYANFIPSKMKNIDFYFDGEQVTEVYGVAQFPSVSCDPSISTVDDCLQRQSDNFPPILFFYKPDFTLSDGNHTFEVKLADEELRISFYIDQSLTVTSEDVCPAIPYLDKYDARTYCSGGYYHTENPIHIPIPRYKSNQVFYTPSLPRNSNQVGKYVADNLLTVKIQGQSFDLILPSSAYFFSTRESKTNNSIVSEKQGLYLPRVLLFTKNGAQPKMFSDYNYHYLDLVPVDITGNIYPEKIKTHQGSNSSGCDG